MFRRKPAAATAVESRPRPPLGQLFLRHGPWQTKQGGGSSKSYGFLPEHPAAPGLSRRAHRLTGLEALEDRFRVALRIDLPVGLRDLAVRRDDVGDAFGKPCLRGIRGAVGQPDFALRVAEERKRVFELLREVRVLRLRVEGDAPDLRVVFLEFRVEVAEPATLDRSTRRVGLRIEPQNDGPAALVGEARAAPPMVPNVKIRGRISWRQHLHVSFLPEQFPDGSGEEFSEG